MSTTTPKSSIQERANMRLYPFMVPIPSPRSRKLPTAWGLREHKRQVANSYRAATDNAQASFTEDGDDFGKADGAMTVKMSNNASLLCQGSSEIDRQHSATGLQHSSNLASALAA